MITYSAAIYLLKVNNRNTRTRCETCSTLPIKTPERRQALNMLLIHAIGKCILQVNNNENKTTFINIAALSLYLPLNMYLDIAHQF